MQVLKSWPLLVGLICLLTAGREEAPAATAPATVPAVTTVAFFDETVEGEHANAASMECANPLPADRQFPLPPWPDTNFCRHSVSYAEITFGGVPRDRIPAIDAPEFQEINEALVWLADVEPVLVWHEIVNDVVAGRRTKHSLSIPFLFVPTHIPHLKID